MAPVSLVAKQKPLAELSPAYRKRLESHIRRGTLVEGAPRGVARGHKQESLEKLRRRTAAHIALQLAAAGTKGPISIETIRKNTRRMSADMCRAVLELDGAGIKAGAALQKPEDVKDFFDGEAPDERPEINPLWYHPS